MSTLCAEFDPSPRQSPAVTADGFASRGAARAEGVGPIAQTFKSDSQQRISLIELMNRISTTGIGTDDPRVREILDSCGRDGGGLTLEQFSAVCEASGGLIARALRGDLVIPDFSRLQNELHEIYDTVRHNSAGAVADYIPQLKRADPEKFGIAV